MEGRICFIVLLYFSFGLSMKEKMLMIILYTKLEAESTLI